MQVVDTGVLGGSDIEVTPAMVEVGVRMLWERDLPPAREDVPSLILNLYRAMVLAQQERWREVEMLLNEDFECRR